MGLTPQNNNKAKGGGLLEFGNKDQGVTAELAVAAELSRRGYIVAWPLGDFARYDIISTSPSGKLQRIQVKTATRSKHGTYRIGFVRGSNQKVKYTPEECDIFIVWLQYDTDYDDQFLPAFYIIPIAEMRSSRGTFYPPGKGRHPTWVCANEKYRDKWEILS